MTKVICQCTDCKYNKDKECMLDVLYLDERDIDWKECGERIEADNILSEVEE